MTGKSPTAFQGLALFNGQIIIPPPPLAQMLVDEERFRTYGFLEIGVGLALGCVVVNQIIGTRYEIAVANAYLTVAGAVYVIVRGYDNIYCSLTAGTGAVRVWNKHFFGRSVETRLA